MKTRFKIGMKLKLQGEYGVVVQGKGNLSEISEPGIIRWDTNKNHDEEDWRGLFGSLIDEGGKIIDPDFEFKFITNDE